MNRERPGEGGSTERLSGVEEEADYGVRELGEFHVGDEVMAEGTVCTIENLDVARGAYVRQKDQLEQDAEWVPLDRLQKVNRPDEE